MAILCGFCLCEFLRMGFCSVTQLSPTDWSWRVSQGPAEDESSGKSNPVIEFHLGHIAAYI